MYSHGIRFFHASLFCVVFILALGWANDVGAQCFVTFDDEAEFLSMTNTPSLESFESLTATNTYDASQFVLPGMTVSIDPADDDAGIYNTNVLGNHPTDGVQYLRYRARARGDVMRFVFSSPKTAFGINIIDWNDLRSGTLLFVNGQDTVTVAMGMLPNGSEVFFGIIHYTMAFDEVLLVQNQAGDAFSVDEIYCEYTPIPPRIMACKDINVSLNEDCYVQVVPAMLLTGHYPCYDDFDVQLDYYGTILPDDTLRDEHIGHHVTAKVIDRVTGNSCWSKILVEDKFAPTVLCQDDTVNCIEYMMHYDTPGAIQQCQLFEIIKVDEKIFTLPCDTHFIKRVEQSFVAKDESGNVSQTCSRTIWVERFPMGQVKCPLTEFELYCQDRFDLDANGHPAPSVTGVPYLFSKKTTGGSLYGVDNAGNYFQVDYETGDIDIISDQFLTQSLCADGGLTEIDIDPVTCTAYAKGANGCDVGFMFDYKTGQRVSADIPTVVKPSGYGDYQGAEVINGIWYVSSVTTDALETFDPLTGAFVTVGSHGVAGLAFNGLAWDGQTLYGCEAQGGTRLYSIDINTGTATLIGDMLVNLGSLEFGPDGHLYGGGGQFPYTGRFYRIDPADGTATMVGQTGLTRPMTGLMWVPEELPLYPQPDFFCNLWVDYRDTDLGEVGCTRKIMRVWEVQEWWCTEDSSRFCTQFIYIKDTTGPEFRFPVDSIYATTKIGFHTCEGDVLLPEPYVRDACHGVDRIDVKYNGGFIKDWKGQKITLPTGFHTVYATAYDSCYNSTVDSIVVHVIDKIAPIAVCDQNTVISLDNDGIVHAYAEVFDDGSFDECAIERMDVRRMDDPCLSGTDEWGDYVEFCCEDVNKEVMVAFRVTDKSGNSGTCMVRVLINDKIPPKVVCPPNITVDCRFDWDPAHLEVFGEVVAHDSLRKPIVLDSDTVRFDGAAIDGVAQDNCPMFVIDSFDMTSIDQCGEGYLERYFKVIDREGLTSNYCVQRITFVNTQPFTENDIVWPQHVDTINICRVSDLGPDTLPEVFSYPRFINERECSLVGYSYKDEVIDNSQGSTACYKIIRKWKVIDWCQHVNGIYEKWEYDQVILVHNTNAPGMTGVCKDTVFCFYSNDCTPPELTLSKGALDDCTFRNVLRWTYKIDLGNDGSFDLIGNTNSVTDVFPADTHKIKWIVEDLCGNETTCEYLFELRNCKAPLAYCKPNVIWELTPMDLDNDGEPDTEMVEVWASDLDDGSSAPCGSPVVFSFSADTSDKVRWYDCDSIGLRRVSIYVTDVATGEQSVCLTSITIQDNNNVNVCPQTLKGTIAGLVSDREGRAVALADAALPGSGAPMTQTSTSGSYSFADMPYGGAYTVMVEKNDDYLNGVTTGDLVRIQRHLLGLVHFDQPWQYIAADVNMNGEVSVSDIQDVRKVILGKANAFSGGKSWRFIDGTYQFLDPNNPLVETLPESIDIPVFDHDVTSEWKGVKLGDIDNSVDPQGLGSNRPRSRVVVTAVRQQLSKYEEANIVIDASNLDGLNACQFTLELDVNQLEVMDVIPIQEGMNFSNFNRSMSHIGLLPFAWENTGANAAGQLFALRVRALQDVNVGDAISVSDAITPSLAMLGEVEYEVALRMVDGNELDMDEVALYQNEPNPWSAHTQISFYLPNDRAVNLTIIDADGRRVWEQNGYYEKGLNSVQVSKDDLQSTGVYYYQIKTGDFIATKKMLIL